MNKKILLFIATSVLLIFSILTALINNNNRVIVDTVTNETKKTVEVLEVENAVNAEEISPCFDGWGGVDSLNVRNKPSIDGKIIGYLHFNDKITYTYVNEDWVKIEYNNKDAYVYSDYILNKKADYQLFKVPSNKGFKSYMDYRCITSTSSLQYKLQNIYANTGNYGIRTVNGRYCIAVGSHFTSDIGQYLDLILENGTVIPCILADQKADIHTDSNNIVTMHNGCVSEFVIDSDCLNKFAMRDGDISSCTNEWDSPVVEIKVYDKNVFNE